MSILWVIGAVLVAFLMLFVVSACRVAARYDEEMERAQRETHEARKEE